MTVITEEEAAQELLKWRDNGYLQFSGKDEDKPAYRVQKMWGEFVRQIEKEKNLKNSSPMTIKTRMGRGSTDSACGPTRSRS